MGNDGVAVVHFSNVNAPYRAGVSPSFAPNRPNSYKTPKYPFQSA